MKRLDQLLVHKGLAPSRTKAKELIELGVVEIRSSQEWRVVSSASFQTDEQTEVRLVENSRLRYASRAGLKLEGALADFSISPEGFYVFDIGQSTGGFTDCLLQKGATEVLGIDVGHGQLAEKIAGDARVIFYEGVHLSSVPEHKEIMQWLARRVDLCVVDVSFISVLKVFEMLARLPLNSLQVLALVKPQFEVGAKELSKSGVVKNEKVIQKTLLDLKSKIEALGFSASPFKPATISGADGNQEFFIKCGAPYNLTNK